jgi:metallophosphoesterase (TIGR00282 family)
MKILFFGDIVGRIGRDTLKKKMPDLKLEHQPDLILANAENLAHGNGVSEKTIKEMSDIGIDFFTSGNHVWDNKQGIEYLQRKDALVIRPANYPAGNPGIGYKILEAGTRKVLLINLLGQVFMKECLPSPFETADNILKECGDETPIIIVDIHAEATSEKQAIWHYLDGRVSAVLGTHTHVPTAYPRISEKGTALVEDIGFVGGLDSVLGADKKIILNRFLTQMPEAFSPVEAGPVAINAVLLDIDINTGKTTSIKRIDIY